MGESPKDKKSAPALDNALLELSQRNAELAVINSVQQGLADQMDMDAIYSLVGDKIQEIFDAQVTIISTFNHDSRTEQFQYLFENGQRVHAKAREYDKLRQRLIKTKRIINIQEDLLEAYATITGQAAQAVPGTDLPKSVVYLPLTVGDEVRGYVSLQNLDREHAFSDSDVQLLITLANSMSVALENARLYNETEQRNAELAVINSVQQGLVAEMEMQGIYDLVGDQIRDLFDAQVVGISTFNFTHGTEEFQYVFEEGDRFYPSPRPIDKIRQQLIDSRQTLDIEEDTAGEFSKITGEAPKAVPGTTFPKSMVFVPLVLGKSVKGYVSLQNLDREHAFSESDVQLLITLANSMTVALENARLFNETEQRNAELAVINSVQQGLVAEMDLQGIYDLVGERLRELFDAQVTGIYSFDHDANLEIFHYLYEDGERLYPEPRPLNSIRQWIIKNKTILHIKENADDAIFKITGDKHVAVPGTRLPKTLLFVPLLVGDTVMGCVSLQNLDREHAFSDSDVQLLSTLSNSTSVALENARLFSETELRNAELAVINSVQEGLVAEIEMQGIYDLVGDKIRDLFDAQVAVIASFNYENNTEEFHYIFEDGKRFEVEPRPVDKVRERIITTGEMLVINENAVEVWSEITGEEPTAAPGTKPMKSAIYVPMNVGSQVRGYVSLQNLDRENAFSQTDIRLLSTLANSMSVALENARLYSEAEQRNAELAVINSVQQGLVAEMDMQGIYDLVGDRIQELFNAQVVAIATFDHEKNMEDFHYIFEDGGRIYSGPRAIDKLRRILIDSKDVLYINENAEEMERQLTGVFADALPGTVMPKSYIFIPLIIGDTVRGYVSLQNLDIENAFSESDVRLLRTLANSMSVALENARLFNESEQRNAELAVINSVQQGLVAEMDMQGIYDLVGDKIKEQFDAQVTVIANCDHKTGTETFNYVFEDGKRFYPETRQYNKIRQHLIDKQKLILIQENTAEEYEKLGASLGSAPGTKVPKSVLFVPMLIGDAVRGYVSLQNLDKENAFSTSDVGLLTTMVNSMSVALENARLFNETVRLLAETEQRNAELAIINSVQEGLVREMDLEAIYSLVGNRICEVLNTQTLIIRTFDEKSENEIWEFAVENDERLFSDPQPLIWANKYLKKTKKPLLINENYIETARKHGDKQSGVSKGLPPKSAIFVPMIVGNEVMGSVSLQNIEKENSFTESDVRLLATLTNSMSVAIQNARLFNETARLLKETEQRATELQTVNNISRAMVSQLEFDALVELVGEQMRETFRADIVYLAIHDRETNMLHFPYMFGETSESRPFGNGITEKIILKQEPLLINQDLDKAYDKMKAEVKGTMVQSFLGVPIIVAAKAIGVISVQSTEVENRFNEYDQRLLTTIAANLGVAMQNAEAYKKLQEALTELKSAQEQLIQSEKMASLGELTAGIAHEIQNPLNFVNNFSEVSDELVDELTEELAQGALEEVEAIAKDLKQNLEKINHHGKRASDIVKGMLEHSRSGDGKKEATDINKLADEYLRLAYHGLRAKDKSFNAGFEAELDPDLPFVNVVPQDIGRVLLNLINNAFHAVSGIAKPTVIVRTKKVGDKIEISVKDNGSGIKDEIKDKIFQPFFTTKPTGQGTGLGLSMSYDIVKAHGGLLTVESELGKGTTFTIELPSI